MQRLWNSSTTLKKVEFTITHIESAGIPGQDIVDTRRAHKPAESKPSAKVKLICRSNE